MSTDSFTRQITIKPNDKQLLNLLGVNVMTIEEYEAEIARLTQGYEDLKDWMQSIIDQECGDQFDRGMDLVLQCVIKKINKITGEGE